MEFLGNVLASIVAGIIMLIVGTKLSDKLRWVVIFIFGRLVGLRIDKVFTNQKNASEDLRNELKITQNIDIITGRGMEFQQDTFMEAFSANGPKIRILLPDISNENKINWTDIRSEELAKSDVSFIDKDILKEQIRTSERFLRNVANKQTEIKQYSLPHFGRIILTDRCMYFTPYGNNHGRDSLVIKYSCGDTMYCWARRLFDMVWMHNTNKN